MKIVEVTVNKLTLKLALFIDKSFQYFGFRIQATSLCLIAL